MEYNNPTQYRAGVEVFNQNNKEVMLLQHEEDFESKEQAESVFDMLRTKAKIMIESVEQIDFCRTDVHGAIGGVPFEENTPCTDNIFGLPDGEILKASKAQADRIEALRQTGKSTCPVQQFIPPDLQLVPYRVDAENAVPLWRKWIDINEIRFGVSAAITMSIQVIVFLTMIAVAFIILSTLVQLFTKLA
jgi:hypothetical protein